MFSLHIVIGFRYSSGSVDTSKRRVMPIVKRGTHFGSPPPQAPECPSPTTFLNWKHKFNSLSAGPGSSQQCLSCDLRSI